MIKPEHERPVRRAQESDAVVVADTSVTPATAVASGIRDMAASTMETPGGTDRTCRGGHRRTGAEQSAVKPHMSRGPAPWAGATRTIGRCP